jgi:hypothetical protein
MHTNVYVTGCVTCVVCVCMCMRQRRASQATACATRGLHRQGQLFSAAVVARLATARTYRTRPPRAHTTCPSRWHTSLLPLTQTVLAAHSLAESPAHLVRDTHLVSGREGGAHNARSPHPVRCPISEQRQLCSGSGSWCPSLPPVHPISDCALRGALSTPSTGWYQRC